MKKAFLICIFCFAQLAIAQNYKFGKVSEEELSQKIDPNYSEANAAILYRKQNILFRYIQGRGFIQENEIHERIKIYNKEGFKYATMLVKLYVNSEGAGDFDETIMGLKAVTYNLEGGKIVEDKLKKEGIFKEVTNKYLETTKFTMPNIKEGCVIEFEYTIQSQRMGIDDIEFQQLIPIKKLDFTLRTPEYLKYKKLLNPRAAYVPKLVTSTKNVSLTINSRERSGGKVSRTSFSTSKIEYKEDVLGANLSNIPPLKDESYVDNLSNYQARLIMELDRVEWPKEPIKYLSSTWEKVTKTIYDNPDFGDQINKKGYYNNDLDAILTGVNDNQQKIDLIYNYVKSKVKWNEYHGCYTENGVSKAYKEGIGNVADINLMLVSMLRYAGISANPVLVSTKSNGIPLIPTRSGFNYVICAVELENNAMLLDASQKFTTTNILPIKTLNWLGRLVRENGTSDWVELIPKVPSNEMVSLNIKLNNDLTASGKVRNQFTNYQAMTIRNKFENYNTDEIIQSIEKGKGELEVTNLEVKNLKDPTQAMTQSYEYTFNNALEEIGGKLYFTPLLFMASDENPFKEDVRNYPIDYIYPINDKYMVNVMLPEGYAVESLPENVKVEFNGTDGRFTYIGNQNGNYLQFIISLDLNNTLILPESYEQYKKFYQLVVEKQTEKVVLKKL